MPEISRFFGIIIRMFYDDHNPPHIHAEYQRSKAIFDFKGNLINGELKSRTATRLVRDWIDLRKVELEADWLRAQSGQLIQKIEPLH